MQTETPENRRCVDRQLARDVELSAAPKNRAPKEESIGVGSGAAIGALAGGPVGLVLGAAFGGWLGDRFHDERSARRDGRRARRCRRAPTRARSRRCSPRASARSPRRTPSSISERVAHRRNLQEALSVEVFFRTEESGVGGTTEERLAKLAALIEPMDGAVIRLEGHTDARGTETFNSTLSTARAEAVREALIRGGMPAERVIVTACRRDELDGSGAGHGRHGARAPRRDERRRRRRRAASRSSARTSAAKVSPEWPGAAAKERGGAPGRYFRW